MQTVSKLIFFCLIMPLAWQQNPAVAADRELLDILLANGAITKQQYDQLLKRDKPLTKNDVEVSLKKGLQIRTTDGDFKMRIGGRLHVQAGYHSRDEISGEEINDGVEIRRARIYVRGVLFRDWKYKADYEFAHNETDIKDVWLAYTGFDWMPFIGIGHQKQPYSLEVEMSSNDMPFVERSLENAITGSVIDRAVGLRMQTHGKLWFAAAGLYGQSIDAPDMGDEGWGTAGRFIFAPVHTGRSLVHLGLRGAYREPGDSERDIRFRYKTTTQSGLSLVNTGRIRDVNDTTLAGAEAALVYGPAAIEGEYTHAIVDRRAGKRTLDFDGFHIQATWTLSGESKAGVYKLKSGEFKGLVPDHDFSLANGGWGAWEIAARYGWVDLNDRDIRGGKAQDFTVALNWYLNPNIRFMFDWTRVLDTDHALGVNWNSKTDRQATGLNIFQVRSQLTF